MREIEHQLSSPITSYDFKKDLTKKATLSFEHHVTYPEPLIMKSTKQELREMRAMVLELKARAQAEDDIILDWEIRDRLAQALNDWYIGDPNIQTEYNLLYYQGYGYLPFVLSAWALWWDCDPATRFELQITDSEYRRHRRMASELCRKDLGDAVDTIWYAIPEVDRSLMIAMWLGRRSSLRTPVVHLPPAAWEAQRVIVSDFRLSEAERDRALRLIPHAVNGRNQHLFTGN